MEQQISFIVRFDGPFLYRWHVSERLLRRRSRSRESGISANTKLVDKRESIPFEKSSLVFGLSLAGVIVMYDYSHKNFPGSVVLMAFARILVYTCVAIALGANLEDLYVPSVLLGFYVLGLTWLARKKERKSYTDFAAAICLFCPILFMTGSEGLETLQNFEWVLLPAFSIWIVWCLINWQKKRMGIAIGGMIAGISLLDASIIAYLGGPSSFVATCILLFSLTLIVQLFVKGT